MTRHAVLAVVFLATACGRPTPYRPVDSLWGPYGYTDLSLGADEYAVTVRANAATDAGRVADMLILRAADVTLARGRGHFVILHRDSGDRYDRQITTVPVPVGGIIVPVPVGEVVHRERIGHLVLRLCAPGGPLPADAVDAAEAARTLRPRVAPAS